MSDMPRYPLYDSVSDAVYYLDCFCCFCSKCFKSIVYDKIKPMVKQKEANKSLGLTFACLFCKQQINLNLMDTNKENFKNLTAQLNANPATMLKSTVRNLEFKEKQMLAQNKFLLQKNGFLETLLKEIVRTNCPDLSKIPTDLLDQDKYNFIKELKESFANQKKSRKAHIPHTETFNCKKSKSEPNFTEPTGRLANMNSIQRYPSDARAIKPPSNSLNNAGQSGPNGQAVASYYGFEVKSMRRGQSSNVGSSAKELEDRLRRYGQNRFMRPQL